MASSHDYSVRIVLHLDRGDVRKGAAEANLILDRLASDQLARERRLSTSRVREIQRGNREQLREHTRAAKAAADEYERHLGGGFFSRLGRSASDAFKRSFGVSGAGAQAGGGFLGNALSVATGNLITGIITGAVDQVKQGIEIGMDFNRLKESTLLGLKRKLGSQREAEAFFNEVAKFAQDDSPLKIAQAVSQANRLLALSFKPDEIITVLRAAGDAAAGMGRVGEEALEKVEQITKALSDIRGKQRVNAEELSRQLQEAGVSGWRYIAEELQRSYPEYSRLSQEQAIGVARELAEKNRLNADAVVGIIIKGLQREYGGMGKDINQNTLAGQESMTEDLMSVVLGTGTAGLFKHKLTGQKAINQLLQGGTANSIAGYIGTGTDTALTGIEDALRSFGLNLPKLGAEGSGSYAEGFKGGTGAAYEAGTAVGGAAEKGIRDKLDQHSPSQVLLKLGYEAGLSFTQGLGQALQGEGGRATREQIDRYVREAAERFKVPVEFIHAIIKNESSYRQNAKSPVGAQGLMQLMPGTAARYRVENAYDPRQNIMGGTAYLADLIEMFRGDLRLVAAAYNAGEGRVRQYGGIPPFRETRAYVPRVMDTYQRLLNGGVSGGGDLTGGVGRFASPLDLQLAPLLDERYKAITDADRKRQSIMKDHLYLEKVLSDGMGEYGGKGRFLMGDERAHIQNMLAQTAPALQRLADEEIEALKRIDAQIEAIRGRLAAQAAADGGSFRPADPFSNTTDEQAQHVLEMMRRARGEGVDEIRLGADQLARTVTPQALASTAIIARETKGAFEDLPPLIKESTKDMTEFAKTVSGMAGGVLQGVLRGRWRDALEGLRDDFLSWTTDLFQSWIQSRIFKALSGQDSGAGGGGSASGGGGSGGGGLLGSLWGGVKKLFGIGGSSTSGLTGGFAGGPGAAGILSGGGITPPTSMTASAAAIQNAHEAIHGSATTGAVAAAGLGGGSFGFGATKFNALAPLLGMQLGGLGVSALAGPQAGGLANLLGMAGGTLVGIGLTGAPAALSGSFLAPLFSNPITAVIGGALLVGGILYGRNKQRQADERTRNEISNTTGGQIWDLIDRARSLSLSQARQEWAQIDAQYHQQIAQLKDGKARRHAELQWTNDFAPMWNIVETRVREGEKSREFKDDFVPTFAAGGAVRAFSDGGSMSPFTGRVPGVYNRRDDRVIRVSGDETVLTPIQRSRLGGHTAMAMAGVPGYADGVTLGGRSAAGDLPPMQITIRVELGSGDRTRIVLEELRSQAGREAVAAAISEDINREGMEGVLGAVTLNLLRRGYV